MHERRKGMIMYGVIAVIASVFVCVACVSAKTKTIYSAVCDNGAELHVIRVKEFVELSYRNAYYLYYQRNGEKPVRLTGTVGVLPKAVRYLKMIHSEDFNPGKTGSMFSIHFIDPSLITRAEFDHVVATYRTNRDKWIEIKETIDILVYGSHTMFHEVFECSNGLFVFTDLMGNVTITDDASYNADTLPREKRHSDNVGYFDEKNVFFPRKGKIVSGVVKDLFEKPAKKVFFEGRPGEDDYTGHVEVLWVDLLYNDKEIGINHEIIYSAKNKDGKRFDEVFRIAD